MTNVREFTNDELQTLSSTHGGVAEQNMSYGICIKVDGHIVKWLTFQAAEQEMQRILGESVASDSESTPAPKPLI